MLAQSDAGHAQQFESITRTQSEHQVVTGVRNGVLARIATGGSGNSRVGTVPNGFTWLIKTVTAVNTTDASVTVTPYLLDSGKALTAHLSDLVVEPGKGQLWEGWVAADPGDELWVSGPAGVHVWAMGAELPGNLPARATTLPI